MSMSDKDDDQLIIWDDGSVTVPKKPLHYTFDDWMRDHAPRLLTGQKLRITHDGEDMGLYVITSAGYHTVTVKKVEG